MSLRRVDEQFPLDQCLQSWNSPEKMCQIPRKLGIRWDLQKAVLPVCDVCFVVVKPGHGKLPIHIQQGGAPGVINWIQYITYKHSGTGVMFTNLTILGASYSSISHLLLGISQFSKLDDGCSGDICHGSGLPRLGAMFEILQDIQPRTWEFKLQHLQQV